MSRIARYGAFSLVEVVIALGIVAFALVSTLSLISIGLKSSKESKDDTNLGLMTQTVITLLRSSGYSKITANVAKVPVYNFDSSGALAYDKSGAPITGTSASTLKKASNPVIYTCTVTEYTPALPGSPADFVYIRLDFAWPCDAPPANRQHQYVYTSLVQYSPYD